MDILPNIFAINQFESSQNQMKNRKERFKFTLSYKKIAKFDTQLS